MVVAPDINRGMVTLKRSFPFIWTPTFWPPRDRRAFASVSVSKGVGHVVVAMLIASASVDNSECRISQVSDVRAGAIGASNRRSDDIHVYRISGFVGRLEESVFVNLVKSDMTVFKA